MIRVDVQPAVLGWACERARLDPAVLAVRIPQLRAWENGEKRPTLKQLEAFGRVTHTPIGWLLGQQPPHEPMPIPDFRAIADTPVSRPTGDLLDTVYLCQQRQWWYEKFVRMEGERPLPFVGSAMLAEPAERVATDIRETLGFNLHERLQLATWTEALRRFIEQAEAVGVLVMVSGVVGSNNRRKLDPAEFRGFALADALAPLVFVNGADAKATQMFTLAHELAHIWLGETALSDSEARHAPDHQIERWCNEVAAELLLPLAVLREEHRRDVELHGELDRLARRFKVSPLVILRRIRDASFLGLDEYHAAYDIELARPRQPASGGGGNFYVTLGARVSKRFARAIFVSTLEGRSSFTEALHLLGIKKMRTFRGLAESLGINHGLPP